MELFLLGSELQRVNPSALRLAIEFAYGVRESNEFVWAVSVEGDREEFGRLEQAYLASDARAAVFDGVPQRVALYDIRFVDDAPAIAATAAA